MNRNRLPKYSDTVAVDLPTLGPVPAHWTIKPLKYVCDFRSGKAHEPFVDEDGEFICVNSRYVSTKGQKVKFCTRNLTPAFDGDVLMVMSDLPNGRALAKAMYVEGKNCLAVNQRVCALTSRAVDGKYLFYFLDRNPLFLMHDDGVNQTHLSNATFTKFPVLRPPLDEQKQIASFLDYETAKIDALIEKQQQLITLLGEKRQAVISHAVTKGLNPDAPMRDSGVEWLGEVPSHWTVKRLKHLFREPLRNGVSPPTANEGGMCTFSIAAVRDGVVNILDHLKYAEISASDSHQYLVQDRDVMMMRGNGSRDLVGSVGIVHELPKQPCIYPDILIRLRFSAEVDPRFGVFFLNSTVSRPQVEMGAKTAAGIWKVSGGTVKEFVVPVPPPEEQVAIREHLEATTGEFDRLVDLAESQEELLQERRTALISAAVTGKIDVRGWKRPSAAPKKETEMEVA